MKPQNQTSVQKKKMHSPKGSCYLGYLFVLSGRQKPRNQKNKKQKTKQQKKKKNKIAHPKRRGSDAECWVLSFYFILCFFWLFCLCSGGQCRCAKQRFPGTVSGCTRSEVDTLQYSNVCYDIVHSANEQQRGMEFNFVRLRHMLLDLCTGNAAICALPCWPVLVETKSL